MAEREAWRHRSLARNAGPPLLLLTGLSAGVFALARALLAKPSTRPASQIQLGDPHRGKIIFSTTCAGCHGMGGSGGIGPRLEGDGIPLDLVVDRSRTARGSCRPASSPAETRATSSRRSHS